MCLGCIPEHGFKCLWCGSTIETPNQLILSAACLEKDNQGFNKSIFAIIIMLFFIEFDNIFTSIHTYSLRKKVIVVFFLSFLLNHKYTMEERDRIKLNLIRCLFFFEKNLDMNGLWGMTSVIGFLLDASCNFPGCTYIICKDVWSKCLIWGLILIVILPLYL